MRRARRSALSRRILLQYVATLAGFAAALFFLFTLARFLYDRFIFQQDDWVYILAQLYSRYATVINGGTILAGWVAITYVFLSRPLRYLDEVVDAAERLAGGAGEPVRLSDAMKSTQDELNSVREGALANAMAAREAEQRKNDLVVYLAHDLKTPLTSVIGYLTLLRDEPQIQPETRARYTGIALEKAERLEVLVNEFFEITRFNLTHLTLEVESVNLTRLTEQVAFEFGPMLAEKNIVCETHLAPEVCIVCDPDKIERVLDNLLKNAVSYSDPGTAIRLLLEEREEKVTLRVENSGRTIPPEKLERIFEQFFRLDTARSSATGGAGLGLAIAREIVELHGGTIVAESADGHTAFTVTLPAGRKKNV